MASPALVKRSSYRVISGEREAAMQNWQRLTVDIPNDKLILAMKETRQSFMPTRIQALVTVRQRLSGICLHRATFRFFTSKLRHSWPLSLSAVHTAENR